MLFKLSFNYHTNYKNILPVYNTFNITKNCIQLRRLADEPINIQVFLKLSDMNCLGIQYYLVGKTSRYKMYLYFSFWIWVLPYTVYRVIFALCYVRRSCKQLQTVSPNLEFAQTHLCLKIDNMKHWNSPSLKFAHWKRGRKRWK